MKNLVLIGGGHSHIIVLRWWHRHPPSNVRLILISDHAYAPYSGMLPGHLAGIYSFTECHTDLRQLAKFAGAEFILDTAIALDLPKSQVLCRHQAVVDFDWLSIDIGSTPATINISGAMEYAMLAKPIPQFLLGWQQFLAEIQRQPDPHSKGDRSLSIGIVGGGAGGVELALTLQSQLQNLLPTIGYDSIEMHLFHRHQALMNRYPLNVSRRLQRLLIERGIQLCLQESVVAIEQIKTIDSSTHTKILHCQSGLTKTCDQIIWVTQAAAPPWIKSSGLTTDAAGFILINENLQSISHPQIFAAGDIATRIDLDCPKAGVFAVRQGQPLRKNLQRMITNQPLRPFWPQQKYLSLIGLGNGQAIAIWDDICVGPSKLLWFWKDRIDRKFMAQFQQL
jgi:selenide, water dikinase